MLFYGSQLNGNALVTSAADGRQFHEQQLLLHCKKLYKLRGRQLQQQLPFLDRQSAMHLMFCYRHSQLETVCCHSP